MTVLLPWLAALGGVLLALLAWRAPAPGPDRALPPGAGDEGEIRMLRRAVALARSENDSLRQELDRLVAGGWLRTPPATAGTATARAEANRGEEVDRLKDALARAAAGDPAGRLEAARGIWGALRSGPQAFATLRDVYEGSPDPRSRELVAAAMLFTRSPDAVRFVSDRVLAETDPALRRQLSIQAAKFATPETAARLEPAFLEALGSADDVELRKASVRGLRYATGDEATSALFAAAADADESVRLAAIETLAGRPELREEIRELLDGEASERVRRVGDCRLLLAERP